MATDTPANERPRNLMDDVFSFRRKVYRPLYVDVRIYASASPDRLMEALERILLVDRARINGTRYLTYPGAWLACELPFALDPVGALEPATRDFYALHGISPAESVLTYSHCVQDAAHLGAMHTVVKRLAAAELSPVTVVTAERSEDVRMVLAYLGNGQYESVVTGLDTKTAHALLEGQKYGPSSKEAFERRKLTSPSP